MMYFLFASEQVSFVVPPTRLAGRALPSGFALPDDSILTAEMVSTDIFNVEIGESTKGDGYFVVFIRGYMKSTTGVSLNEGDEYASITERTPFEMIAGAPKPSNAQPASTVAVSQQSAPQLGLTYSKDATASSIGSNLRLNHAMIFGENPWFGRADWKGGEIPLITGYVAPAWSTPSP